MNVANTGLGWATPTPFAAKITRRATAPTPTRIRFGILTRPNFTITTANRALATNQATRHPQTRVPTPLESVRIQRQGKVTIATGTGQDDTPTTGQLWPRTG